MEKRPSLWQSIFSLVASGQGVKARPGGFAPFPPGDVASRRADPRVRILFLGSNPAAAPARRDLVAVDRDEGREDARASYSPLALDEEARTIERALNASARASSFELVTKWAVRGSEVQEHLLRHRPHLVHLSGHGDEREGLVLLDADGGPQRTSVAALAALFKVLRDDVRVVLLNACWSAAQATAISQFVDCVIGMRLPLSDPAAISFAGAFYGALGFGRTVREAFELGKVALALQGFPESHVPQLFERSVEGRT
jgi:CHAT domain